MSEIQLRVGQLIRVTQEIDRREGSWRTEVTGAVLHYQPERTGSWHAHGKDDKLWLNRIRIRKLDGELTTVVIDPHTRVEILSETTPQA